MTDLKNLLTQLCAGDDDRAEAAAHQIAALGREATPDLRALAASSEADQRWWALRTLALIPDSRASAALQAGLNDGDLAVRQCAALGLVHQPTGSAVPALIAALLDDDPLLTRLAADALIAIGSDSVPALIKVVEDKHASGRVEAARALASIGDQSAIPVLYLALDDPSMLVQHWAEEGLTRMGVGMAFFSPE